MTRNVSLTVALSPEVVKKLEKRAKDEMRTRSNMASKLIAEGLEK